MVQSAEDPRRRTSRSQSQQFTATPSTALAKITEVVDQVRTLTGRSKKKDALWDVTKLTLRTLRDKLDSGLWLLRALWYAEPIQLVTIGRWMSRVDRETTKELNALHAYIRARDDYEQIETDDEYEDARQYQSNRHAPNAKKTTLTHGTHSHHTGDTSSRYRDTPPSHDKYRHNVTRCTPRANDCWPPVGKCQSCGFYPEQRTGDMCIALAKRRSHCSIADHTERACDNIPEPYTFKSDICIDGDNTINKTTTTNAPKDKEVHLPQDTTPGGKGNSKEQYDARPTEPENRKPHHRHRDHRTNQNATQATTKDAPGTATQEIETSVPHTIRRRQAEKGPIESFKATNTTGPRSKSKIVTPQ